jgi:hypothetical protein
MYPESQAFTDSTAAARVNGALGGNARLADLEKEIDSYGISPESRELLRRRAK